MIDTLELNRSKAELLTPNLILKNNLLYNQNIPDRVDEKYAVISLHRPSNVDDKEILSQIIQFILDTVVTYLSVIWPMHSRTHKNIQQFDLLN